MRGPDVVSRMRTMCVGVEVLDFTATISLRLMWILILKHVPSDYD